MKTKQIWANLGVEDVQRSEKFYASLGFKPNGANNTNDKLTSFLFSDNNFVIHFFKREKLQEAMTKPTADLKNGHEIIFSLSADTEEEVHDWVKKVKEAGGEILKQAGRDKDGYFYCVFSDPDGHLFNVLLIEKGM